MRKIVITIITIFLLALCLYAATQETKVAKENEPFTKFTLERSEGFKGRPESILKEGPDILVLEKFSDQYGPVRFKHQLHVQPMAAMGMECSVCHHYSSPDDFPPCSKCHSTKRDEINSTQLTPVNPFSFPLNRPSIEVNRPSIEGAYHRQCINCHSEWSHNKTECSSCHVKKVAGESNQSRSAITVEDRFTNVNRVDEHPAIEAPDRRMYNTPRNLHTIVTFLHREHVELFDIECVDCHREGNCSLCHDPELEKPRETAISKRKADISILERHKPCISCHTREGNCQKCHVKDQKQGFDHAQSTGWPLKQYHLSLNCSDCHIIKGEFGKLETECDVCHRGWTPENFNHSVTGIALDKDHKDIDCKDCHPDNKFDKEVTCSGSECHGEDIKYPERLPGPRTNEEGKK